MGEARQSTPTIPKTLNPEWNVSFEMPVVGVPLLECICWDHDRFGKDYLGEFDIALEDIFEEGQISQEVGEGLRPGWKQIGSNITADWTFSPNGTLSNRNDCRNVRIGRRRRTATSRVKSSCSSRSPTPRISPRRPRTRTGNLRAWCAQARRMISLTRSRLPTSSTSSRTKRPPMRPMTCPSRRSSKNAGDVFGWLV